MRFILFQLGGLAIGFTLLAILLLGGCASYEGAGFSNSVGYKQPACVKSRDGLREVWGSC